MFDRHEGPTDAVAATERADTKVADAARRRHDGVGTRASTGRIGWLLALVAVLAGLAWIARAFDLI